MHVGRHDLPCRTELCTPPPGRPPGRNALFHTPALPLPPFPHLKGLVPEEVDFVKVLLHKPQAIGLVPALQASQVMVVACVSGGGFT